MVHDLQAIGGGAYEQGEEVDVLVLRASHRARRGVWSEFIVDDAKDGVPVIGHLWQPGRCFAKVERGCTEQVHRHPLHRLIEAVMDARNRGRRPSARNFEERCPLKDDRQGGSAGLPEFLEIRLRLSLACSTP